MLKKSIYIAILLLLSSPLLAYEKGDKIFYLKGGYGFSIGDDIYKDATPNPIAAWNAGLAFEYFFVNSPQNYFPINISFISELLYEKQPVSYRVQYNDKLNYNFSYVTIPIGVGIIFSEFFLINSGLYYAKKYKSYVTLDSMSIGKLDNAKDDIGLFGDFGLNFKISELSNLVLYIRSKVGLVELQKNSDLHAYAITINAAYGFKF